jgi:hypothetical protein
VTEGHPGQEGRRRLEKAGFVLTEGPEGEQLWREPGTGQLFPGGRADELVRQREERELREAGWESEEVEGVTFWRRPDSGHLYPLEAAHDLESGEDEGGGASGRGSSRGADRSAD